MFKITGVLVWEFQGCTVERSHAGQRVFTATMRRGHAWLFGYEGNQSLQNCLGGPSIEEWGSYSPAEWSHDR